MMYNSNPFQKRFFAAISKKWAKISAIIIGFGALVWFLVRVIPKPSRASYSCQQAAFPLASAFVIWLAGVVASMFAFKKLGHKLAKHKILVAVTSVVSMIVFVTWFTILPSNIVESYGIVLPVDTTYVPAVGYDWKPGPSNQPIGKAKGVYPGRVVMSRNPDATKWAGNWKLNDDQWWLDKNTDKEKVSEMLSVILKKLTDTKKDKQAWDKIFKYYNLNTRGMNNRGYVPGEVVAVKINLNNSGASKVDNQTDATPQMVLAVLRQLVNEAGILEKNIILYDARRYVYPYMLTTIWKEFKDIRILQNGAPKKEQPVNPWYGNQTGLETVEWVEGIMYSAGTFKDAKLIPKQIVDATYIVNLALLKLHSYPYDYMEDGDEGQTAITMSSKNHAGTIKGTPELHPYYDTKKDGKINAYNPLIDLAASPNVGAKTILYLLDGLYCGRKWRSYPLHFPNPPFNNRLVPYENTDWPACELASLDEVALQSVGLDIMYAQSKNNTEPTYHNVPRIMVRENADDILRQMAAPENALTKYIQDGKPVTSMGVFEHWDNDASMRYSRNVDPKKGKGIDFIYIPMKEKK
jgi:hypothetical protein